MWTLGLRSMYEFANSGYSKWHIHFLSMGSELTVMSQWSHSYSIQSFTSPPHITMAYQRRTSSCLWRLYHIKSHRETMKNTLAQWKIINWAENSQMIFCPRVPLGPWALCMPRLDAMHPGVVINHRGKYECLLDCRDLLFLLSPNLSSSRSRTALIGTSVWGHRHMDMQLTHILAK